MSPFFAVRRGHGVAGRATPSPPACVCSVDPSTCTTPMGWACGGRRRTRVHTRRSLSTRSPARPLLSPFFFSTHHLVHAARAQGRPHRVRHGLGGLNVLNAHVVALRVIPEECGGGACVSLSLSHRRSAVLMRGATLTSHPCSHRDTPSAPPHPPAHALPHALKGLAPNGGRDGGGSGHSSFLTGRQRKEEEEALCSCCSCAGGCAKRNGASGVRWRRGPVWRETEKEQQLCVCSVP